MPRRAAGSADMGEYAVQLVEAVVAHHQTALTPRGVLDGYLGTELVGQFLLEALHVRIPVPCRGLGRCACGRRRSRWKFNARALNARIAA